jgi:hypothetical protein
MHFDLKRKTALLAAAAAIAVAGCGGGDELSEEDYATEVEDVLTTFGEESVALGTELSSATSPDQLRSGVDELQALTQTAVDDLNDIEPPEDAAEGHETLTGALEGYLADIETLAAGVEGDDPEAAQEAALKFQEAAVDVQSELAEAASQLEEAGIDAPSGE